MSTIVQLAQADFLDLLDRLLPFDYLAPLKNIGPGYEIYRAEAAIGARVSQAIYNFQQASFIQTASDGSYAQAAVLFSRANANAGTVTVKAGTIVQTANYGRQFRLLVDVAFGATDLFAPGTVQALYKGEQWNVKGPYTTAGRELVPGEINQIVTWSQSPAFGDPTITVAQTADATGGASSVLNLHGSDRGFSRQSTETAIAFQERIRSLPFTVTPFAIQSFLSQFATRYPGTNWDFIEPFQQSFQECWDCPSPNIGTPTYLATIPIQVFTNLFVYDDTLPAYPFQNRWLDETDFRGAFIVVVPVLQNDIGFFFDDTAMNPTAIGGAATRAVDAYDVPSLYTASTQGFLDGLNYTAGIYSSIYATLQGIKLGGVKVILELHGQ